MVGAHRLEERPSERVRRLAGELFGGRRGRDGWRLGGLNGEREVRDRLRGVAIEAVRAPDVDGRLRPQISRLDFLRDDPHVLLEQTEALIDRVGARLSIEDRLNRLLLIQVIAGRLGRWAARKSEIPDARIAAALFRDVPTPEWGQYQTLMARAAAAFEEGAHRESVLRYLEADRLVRTPAGLLRVSVLLCRLGDHVSALWAVRAALLEPVASFESADAHRAALILEQRLRLTVDTRRETPLDEEERRLLRGESVPGRNKLGRVLIVDRRPPSPLYLAPVSAPVVPRMTVRPLQKRLPRAPSLPAHELLAAGEELMPTTEIIPPLERGVLDPTFFDGPLQLVSSSFELNAPFEERSPVSLLDVTGPVDLVRAEVRPFELEETSAPDFFPLVQRVESTSAFAAVALKKTYDKTQKVRARAYEAVLMDPIVE